MPPPPAAKPALANDEALINPHFMQQLLRYGLQMGLAGNHMDAEQLAADAQVCLSARRRVRCVLTRPPPSQRLVTELRAVQGASE